MHTPQIARQIAKRKLYRRRDGLAASTKDVSARVAAYPELFERQGAVVRLRNMPPPSDEYVAALRARSCSVKGSAAERRLPRPLSGP